MSLSGSRTLRFTEGQSSPLQLLGWLSLALALITIDLRAHWLAQVRYAAATLVEPVYWFAAMPARLWRLVSTQARTHEALIADNRHLRAELLLAHARLERLQAVADENRHLRDLLGGTRGYSLGVRLASLIDVDLDPGRKRIVIDLGANAGVQIGQALIDTQGLLGQIVRVLPRHSEALLITDPEMAVPVQVQRSGLRLIAYGTGSGDRLDIRDIPRSGDIRVDDILITSGIGGHFPAGFPVGRVLRLHQDPTRLFLSADIRPSAAIDRAHQVLLVWSQIADVGIGPPSPPTTHIDSGSSTP